MPRGGQRSAKSAGPALPDDKGARAGWERAQAPVALTAAEVAARLAAALPGVRLVAMAPLGGGLMNTTLALRLDRAPWRAVLRIGQRGAGPLAKEAAILRRLAGRVPLPRLLHDATAAVPPWMLLAHVDGTGLDDAAAGAGGADAAALGQTVGAAVAAIHAERFAAAAFLGPDLRAEAPVDMGGAGAAAFLDTALRAGPARTRLGAALADQVRAHAARHAGRLDGWPTALVHGDLNPTNLLLRHDGTGWRVAAVLDWEYALAANPALDLGTLLRRPLGAAAGYAEGLAAGYAAAGGALPPYWRRAAMLADMLAWADLLRAEAAPDAARIAGARAAAADLLAAA